MTTENTASPRSASAAWKAAPGTLDGDRVPLRAADWRFFLTRPRGDRFEHLVVLGGTAKLMARVANLGLAHRVSEAIIPGQSADALVVLHSARATPKDMVRCLVPGGALYWEVNRRSLRHIGSTPRRLQNALGAVGLSPTGVFALGPNVYYPRVYLPLDVSNALRWYFDTLYNPWTRSVALVEMMLRALIGLDTRRFASIAPDLAITAVAGEPAAAPSLVDLAIDTLDPHGRKLRPLMLTSTHPETLSQRVVVLPFAYESTQPVAVVKVSKLPALNEPIENERNTLTRIRGLLDPDMQRTIPTPLRIHRLGDLTVATESYQPGESLQRSSCRWRRPLREKLEDLRLATAWLAEFHRQTTSRRPPWGDQELMQFVSDPVARYRLTFGETGPEKGLFAAAERYGQRLTGTLVPIVVRKPDFFGSNVVRSGNKLSVVDWESSQPGPALCDLLRFVVPWSDVVSRLRGPRSLENFRRVFFGPRDANAVVRAVHEVIAQYMTSLDMDESLFPVLLLYTWLERALHHSEKQRLQGVVSCDARMGNRHVARIEVLAEHTQGLFGNVSRDPL